MKISDIVKLAIEEIEGFKSHNKPERAELSLLLALLAVDGTANPRSQTTGVGELFKNFILDNIDIIQATATPLKSLKIENNASNQHYDFNRISSSSSAPYIIDLTARSIKNNYGNSFEEILYKFYRCNLAHGQKLLPEYSIEVNLLQITFSFSQKKFGLDFNLIYGILLSVILDPVNQFERIADDNYFIDCPNTINIDGFWIVDDWWGRKNDACNQYQWNNFQKTDIDNVPNYVPCAQY